MKRKANTEKFLTKAASAGLVLAMVITGVLLPFRKAEAANTDTALEQFYQRAAPQYDLNLSRNLQNLRQIGGQQLAALEQFKSANNAPNMQIRWNTFGGSPDAIYDFASQSFSGTTEEAGKAFLAQNAAIFGISDVKSLRVFSEREALGGHLVRFQQTFNDIPVKDGGIGLVMNADNQIIMASGPFFRDVSVNTQPNLTPEQAKAVANNDLNQFNVALPSTITNLLQPGLNILSQQASVIENLQPTLEFIRRLTVIDWFIKSPSFQPIRSGFIW